MYDVVIIGGGPAGLSAALYAGRGGMKTLVFEKLFCGGQAALTYEIENYPGFLSRPSGSELAQKLEEHAKTFGAEFSNETVKEIENAESAIKVVKTRSKSYETRSIIFAMGAKPRLLGVDGEAKLKGLGVSYCATCDGAFFKGQTAVVVGGGNTACEDALYLANFCTSVYLVHRRDRFRADKVLADKILSHDKITPIMDSVIEKIIGDTAVKAVELKNVKSGQSQILETAAVFVAVGVVPENDAAKGVVELDEGGFIKTDVRMRTSIPGIFAAGDVRNTVLRQVVTAVSDGAVAATSAINYVSEQ
ncbi:MAG: thioredoxin-disulfide reductase [Clostridia bacterium]|nr:thioredoxin-disulfide reductase [Clostridia bacterium]